MKYLLIGIIIGLFFMGCQKNAITPAPKPYFVNTPDPNDSMAAVGYNVLLRSYYALSVDTSVFRIDSTKIDSSFSCSGSTCAWNYTMEYDTVVIMDIKYSSIDSQRSFQSVKYSFFDADNDSCEIHITLLDQNSGTTINPESAWGDLFSRPGLNKTISFYFHGKYSYQNLQTVITLAPINDPSNSASVTISSVRSMGDTDKVVADSTYFQMISGKWKMIIDGSSIFEFSGTGYRRYYYSKQNTGVIIKNDSIAHFSNDSLGTTNALGSRSGWSVDGYTLIGKDTLIYGSYEYTGLNSSGEYTALFVRDTTYH